LYLKKWHWLLDIDECRTSQLNSGVIYFRTPFILEDVSRLLNPDIVLTGNAERYLVDPPAYNQSPPYFIHFISNYYNSQLLSDKDIIGFSNLFKQRTTIIDWLNSLSVSIPFEKQKSPLNINKNDIENGKDVDFCRDMATYYMHRNEIEIAYHLINIAFYFRKTENVEEIYNIIKSKHIATRV
jgi:hypothetical protein